MEEIESKEISEGEYEKQSREQSEEQQGLLDLEKLYSFGRPLGKGSYGSVVFVKSIETSKKYALKLIPYERYLMSKESIDREFNILSNISIAPLCHPHIICYYDKFPATLKNQKYECILMEYIKGTNLEEYIEKMNKAEEMISPDIMNALVKTLLSTLAYMHSKGVVHRDIKTENIMFGEKSIKYIDFGFSCEINSLKENLRCGDQVYGTPEFMAPEVVFGLDDEMKDISFIKNKEMLKKSDVWALGMVFYSLVNGFNPLDNEETAEAVFKRIINNDIEPSIEYIPPVDAVIKAALTFDVNERPTAQELLILFEDMSKMYK